MSKLTQLSRRERQILGVLYRLQEASANDVQSELPDAPGNSSVRTHLRKLVDKGIVGMRESGLKYVYFPLEESSTASKTLMKELIETFYGGTPGLAVNQLLSMNMDDISEQELDELEQLIRETRKTRK